MNIQAITECLRHIELFQEIPEHALQLFAECAEQQQLSAGQALFHRGDSAETLFIVAAGSVQLFDNKNGSEQSVTVFSRYEFIGENILIAPEYKQDLSARALMNTTVFRFDKEQLLTLFNSHGELATKVYATISQIIIRRMEHANNRYENIAQLYRTNGQRTEHDLLGDKAIPDTAYYGIQTLRALENFDISDISLNFYPSFIRGLAGVKKAAALANHELDNLSDSTTHAISQACDEISMGMLHNHFIVDMIQGGAGTSTNMNANEVIANRALKYWATSAVNINSVAPITMLTAHNPPTMLIPQR